MNKYTKFLIAILCSIILILAAAIARFYWNVSKSSSVISNQIDSLTEIDRSMDGYCIFTDSSGMYGVLDRSNRIIVDAEWKELEFFSSGYLLAKREVDQQDLVGILNMDGDVIVPFLYSDMQQLTKFLIVGVIGQNVGYVFYSDSFDPISNETWDRYQINDHFLTAFLKNDTFHFEMKEHSFHLTSFDLTRASIPECTLSFSLESSDVTLLTVQEWGFYMDLLEQFAGKLKSGQLGSYAGAMPEDMQNLSFLHTEKEITMLYADNVFSNSFAVAYQDQSTKEQKMFYVTVSIKRNEQNQLTIADVRFS